MLLFISTANASAEKVPPQRSSRTTAAPLAKMAFRVGVFLLAATCSEALTSSQIIRPKLGPYARSVALVASLEAAANLERAPRRESAPNLERVELVASADTAKTPWLERLNKVSNMASILCAIDCTVFPVLLTLLPILNMGSSGKYEVRHAPTRNRTLTPTLTA